MNMGETYYRVDPEHDTVTTYDPLLGIVQCHDWSGLDASDTCTLADEHGSVMTRWLDLTVPDGTVQTS